MKLIFTNLPAFYKINLYNEVNKNCRLKVVFTGADSETRNNDFYHGKMEFEHVILRGSIFQKMWTTCKLIFTETYTEVIVGGWDNICYWTAVLLSGRRKNSVIVESSDYESSVKGFMGGVKKLFFTRINKAYCSGKPHERLVRKLGFKEKVIITKGVGVFNYHDQTPFVERKEVKNFLYVGRLVEVKNLKYLVQKFNKHPELNLHIIGFGELEEELKAMSNANIVFHGPVDNVKLSAYYQTLDVFILPSIAEPWGLVVEEALNNGMPVMVSDRVGCHDDLVCSETGVVFSLHEDDFETRLKEICNLHNYNQMRKHISTLNFEAVEKQQVDCYIDY